MALRVYALEVAYAGTNATLAAPDIARAHVACVLRPSAWSLFAVGLEERGEALGSECAQADLILFSKA